MITNALIFIVFTLRLYTPSGFSILAGPSWKDLSASEIQPLSPAEERGYNVEQSKAIIRNALNPRWIGPIPIPNHWSLVFDSTNIVIPSATATAMLADFYAAVEVHAAAVQHQFTNTAAVRFHQGGLALNFESIVGNIPWSLVQNFAILMQEITGRGLVGSYQARATHLSGIVVYIGLQLANNAAAGE